MYTIDIALRINDALRERDPSDLRELEAQVRDLLIGERERDVWLALIESVAEAIDELDRLYEDPR